MSILIPGKMPTSCARCPCANDETPFCRAANKYIPMLGKPEWCPITELPPSAEIMDYDSLNPDSEWSYYEDGYTAYSMNAIRAACIQVGPEKEDA